MHAPVILLCAHAHTISCTTEMQYYALICKVALITFSKNVIHIVIRMTSLCVLELDRIIRFLVCVRIAW